MIQLLGFYSLHLILYPKLASISSSIPSSAFLSHSYAVYQNFIIIIIIIITTITYVNLLAQMVVI